jgi:hypothetical protein
MSGFFAFISVGRRATCLALLMRHIGITPCRGESFTVSALTGSRSAGEPGQRHKDWRCGGPGGRAGGGTGSPARRRSGNSAGQRRGPVAPAGDRVRVISAALRNPAMRYSKIALRHGTGCRPGRLAQRESASFTPRRSLVRSQYRPPFNCRPVLRTPRTRPSCCPAADALLRLFTYSVTSETDIRVDKLAAERWTG